MVQFGVATGYGLHRGGGLGGGLGDCDSETRGDAPSSGAGGKDKRRKPITVSGPYIVYMLSETDILEDWTLIRKALTSSKRIFAT